MHGKQAILVMASGGVPIGSKLDFATPYLTHVLKFIGIDNVLVVDGNQYTENEQALARLLEQHFRQQKHTISASGG